MRWMALACVLIGGIGCINDHLVQCPDGLTCPTSLVCDVAHHSCTTQEQIAACTDLPDLAPCLTASTCHEGVCLANGCGNRRVDPPESCDDGNTTSGDGCASDCSSNEACGNGMIDLVRGETCDDGNRRSHDGCDSMCATELPRWRKLTQTMVPQMSRHAAAYDPVRRRVVVFGGSTFGTQSDRTLEYAIDTSSWVDVSPAISPPARDSASMAYDAARGVVVLFGGAAGSTTFGDTWTWDGRSWREITTPIAPSPRAGAGMTYDSRRRRVVLFGGLYLSSTSTWEWDGAQWLEVAAPGAPPCRSFMPFAYDPAHGNVVMYGGFGPTTARLDDGTWLYDGTTWRGVDDTLPRTRALVPLVYDPAHGGMMLAGDTDGLTFVWNGASWSQLGNSSFPTNGLQGFIGYYNPRYATTFLVAGRFNSDTSTTLAWTPVINGWMANPTAVTSPPADLERVAMAYDTRRNVAVRFGGFDGTSPSLDTYELVDDAWILRSVRPPPARADASLVYDSTRGRSLLFGGTPADDNTYEWDGSAWTSIAIGTPNRASSGAVYDPVADRVMLFGGTDGNAIALADTFVFDGAWQSIASTAPTRASLALVYDEHAQHSVMVTGATTVPLQQQENDTWTWTLSGGWTKLLPAAVPTGRSHAAAAYDPLRQETVLFGGRAGSTKLSDTWRWNGSKWTRIDVELLPPARDGAALVYDRAHERFIAYGPDTWALQWASQLQDEVCLIPVDRDGDGLAGCDDPDCAAVCAGCGNGSCDPAETCRSCPGDCGTCAPQCGDTFCEPPETAQSCPGDCL